MAQMWKAVCRMRDLTLEHAHLVPRGLAWQELPGVEVRLDNDAHVLARLAGGGRVYSVRIEGDKVLLDLAELNEPASRAEAALAGSFAVTPHA